MKKKEETKVKIVFLVCDEEKKEKYRERLVTIWGESCKFVENIEESNIIYVVGEITEEKQKYIDIAKNLKIRIAHKDENLTYEYIRNAFLSNNFSVEVKK